MRGGGNHCIEWPWLGSVLHRKADEKHGFDARSMSTAMQGNGQVLLREAGEGRGVALQWRGHEWLWQS